MAKTAMEKQDILISQFMNIARNAHRSTVKSITQQLIEEGQLRKAEREKRAQAAKEAPRYSGYYAAKYAAEAAAQRKAEMTSVGKKVQRNRK